MRIGPYTDPVEAYQRAVSAAKSPLELADAIEPYAEIAPDAVAAVRTIERWSDFATGLARERKGHFAGEDWARRYGAILLPEFMFKVSIVAEQFKVPWGLAFGRLRDVGRIQKRGDHWQFVDGT
jgi:hypothetical protein